MINELGKKIHGINKKNGFYEDEKNIGEMLALIHSEVSEALEADRRKDIAPITIKSTLFELSDSDFKSCFRKDVKNSFEDELADIMIRVMDLAAFKSIDLEAHIKAKVRYNSLREYKHGKNY